MILGWKSSSISEVAGSVSGASVVYLVELILELEECSISGGAEHGAG